VTDQRTSQEKAAGDEDKRQIRVVGLSHHTAPLEVRERVAFNPEDYGPTLRHLTGGTALTEGVLLSTCNRSELIAVVHPSTNGRGDESRFRDILSERAGTLIEPYLYSHNGNAAVEHLFRVASSLDSMVVGEAQILGQVSQAFEAAVEAGTSGPVTDRLFSRARMTAKRVRTETGIGQLHVSVSSVAVELAEKIFSSLSGRSALVVGAGETGMLTLQHMTAAGIQRAYVTNRTGRRADQVAESLGVVAVPFERRFEFLHDVDIVISVTGADSAIFSRAEVSAAMSRRRHRPIFLIDLAVPRDIEPSCAEIDGVFLYNIDDLKQVVDRNMTERAREAERARLIVTEEATRFLSWFEAQHAVPTVVALRRRVEEIARAEKERHLGKLKHLSPGDRAAVEAYGASIVNKILHSPTVRLKESSDPRETARLIEAVRELFYLDEEDEESSELPK
jgi:glutamyl-tRNA reductase